jgi:hypothetical protein
MLVVSTGLLACWLAMRQKPTSYHVQCADEGTRVHHGAWHMTHDEAEDCADAHSAGGGSLSFRHALWRQATQGGLLGRANCRLLQPPYRYRGAHGGGGPEAGPLTASLRKEKREKSAKSPRNVWESVRASPGTASHVLAAARRSRSRSRSCPKWRSPVNSNAVSSL